jgi:UDP-glucose 4-epimerase
MPSAVIHLGFTGSTQSGAHERRDIQLEGTKQLLDHCVHNGVQRLVSLSSSHVYGALPDHSFFLDEDTPLFAGPSFPELRDLVEIDTLVSAFLWRHPDIRSCVLRPVNVLGYYAHSMLGQYLCRRRVFTVMGFDPMMQFIHEEDLCRAITLALEHRLQGVYNVTGPGEVPLHTAVRAVGGETTSVPDAILRSLFRRLYQMGVSPYPSGVVDFLKFPTTLLGERFIGATNFSPMFGLKKTFQSVQG